jgi:hypothetical protein
MNPTQTHKVFGQGVRGMLAVAIAASAVSTASVKAGPTEDTVAAAMNSLVAGDPFDGKNVKAKNTDPAFVNTMIASFAVTFGNPNIGSVASKLTASKLFTFYQKGLPEYSPNLAQLAVDAALNVNSGLKYKDPNARIKDAAKIGGLAIKSGMKAYPKGTRNSAWTGFVTNTNTVQQNLANIAYQTTAALGVSPFLNETTAATVTTSLVKAAYKFKKTTTAGPGSVVLGFVSQVGEDGTAVTDNVQGIITGAVKGAKKESLSIANAAAYALYALYLQAGGTDSPADWAADHAGDIYQAVLAADKKADANTIAAQVLNGATSASNGDPLYGAQLLSPGDDLLVINNGDQAPVTKITNL